MSDDTFHDPSPPEEKGELVSGDDLLNKVCVFYPRAEGTWPARAAADGKDAIDPRPYIECEVWMIGVAGVEQHGFCRLSWWRSLPGLRERMGSFVAGTPKVNDDRSRTIEPLSPQAKTAVEGCREQIIADRDATNDPTEPEPESSDEPF